MASGLALTACAPAGSTTATPSAAPSAVPSAAPMAGFTADQLAAIDAAAAASLKNGITGTVVGIVDPKRGTVLRAYGTADTAGTPVTPNLHYRIASVTKTFTAYAVLRLVDEGKVALTDPISRYVADVRTATRYGARPAGHAERGLRLRQRQSVLRRSRRTRRCRGPTTTRWRSSRHAAEFTPPNQATVYNNSNYVLLGYVIAKAAGPPAPEYFADVTRELGLANTSYQSGDALPELSLRGYLADATAPPPPGGYRDVTASNPAVAGTAGAMVSTVPDMLRYAVQLGTGAGLTRPPRSGRASRRSRPPASGSSTGWASRSPATGSATMGRSSATATWCSTSRRAGRGRRCEQRRRRDRRAVPGAVG